MRKKGTRYIWVYKPQPPQFVANEKAKIIAKAKDIILNLPKITGKVSRLTMRANRIYLYELIEQFLPEGAQCTKPLANGNFIEYPYARITLQDTQGNNCTVDWLRHNDQWMTLYTGTLTECLSSIENDEEWF